MKISNAFIFFVWFSYTAIADEDLNIRTKQLALQIKCPVCNGQSIEDSNAPLAKELRKVIRERLNNGHTDAQILSELVHQYGIEILLNPPFQLNTYLLWLTPIFLAILMGFYLLRIFFLNRSH
jgi:cytochrome c-type biogenesis protein CcmH